MVMDDCGSVNKRFTGCHPLAMSQSAACGWQMIHVKPHAVFMGYCFSVTGMLVSQGVLYGIGLPWFMLMVHFAYMVATVAIVICAALMWRSGPKAACGTVYKMVLALYSAASLLLLGASFAGPLRYTPFSDLVVTTIGSAVYLVFASCSSLFGGSAADHPREPHQTLWPPLTSAAFITMRFMDVLTDMGFVRILVTQVICRSPVL